MKRFVVFLAFLAMCVALESATIVERSVEINVSDTRLTEKQLLVVELIEPGDLEAWSEFSFFLDDNVALVECRAEVVKASGLIKERVKKGDFHQQTSAGFGLHTSGRILTVPFRDLDIGERIRIELTRNITPYYPAHSIDLVLEEDQENLQVKIHGNGDNFRWTVIPADDRFSITAYENGVEVTGSGIERYLQELNSADTDSTLPILKIAWGKGKDWRSVGEWYNEFAGEISAGTPSVRKLAAELTSGLETNREKLIALTEYVKREIRYEAVEIGAGGWQPTPADEVVERGWGDCKDKAELLRDLLKAVEMNSYLTLLRLGRTARIDPDFPSTLGFNHCILAVPAAQIEGAENEVIVEDLLFIDATMDRGDALWLSPYNQGHWALVSAGPESRLVHIPVFAESEVRLLVAEGVVDQNGNFSGAAVIRFAGSPALPWLRDFERENPARIEENARRFLQRNVSGIRVQKMSFKELEGKLPGVELWVRINIPSLVRGSPGRRRLRPGLLSVLPEPRVLDGRLEPAVLSPGLSRTTWRLSFPDDWCPIVEIDDIVSNQVGSVSYQASVDENGLLIIDHKVSLNRWWIDSESLEETLQLAVAENLADRRNLRMRCTTEE